MTYNRLLQLATLEEHLTDAYAVGVQAVVLNPDQPNVFTYKKLEEVDGVLKWTTIGSVHFITVGQNDIDPLKSTWIPKTLVSYPTVTCFQFDKLARACTAEATEPIPGGSTRLMFFSPDSRYAFNYVPGAHKAANLSSGLLAVTTNNSYFYGQPLVKNLLTGMSAPAVVTLINGNTILTVVSTTPVPVDKEVRLMPPPFGQGSDILIPGRISDDLNMLSDSEIYPVYVSDSL